MIWVYLSSARGPAECEIAVANIVQALCNEAHKAQLSSEVIESRETDHGLLSALIAIEGETERAFAESWNGSIQWVCQSPMRGKASRRNWFIGGSIISPPSAEQQFNERDLHFSTFRSSGPGGQHVNKTNSAVRVTHRPTGLIAQAQEERSQSRNKALAVARLAAMVADIASAAVNQTEQSKWTAHDALVRGNPIRVYKGMDFLLNR